MNADGGDGRRRDARSRDLIAYKEVFEQCPGLFLLLDPDLFIVTASDAYLQATMTTREAIADRHLFDVFPDNPDDPRADGTARLGASLDRVRARLAPDAMSLQKYDVRKPEAEGGEFEERWWSPINTPVLDGQGRLVAIVHRADDVTELVRLRSTVEHRDVRTSELEHERTSLEELLFRRTRELENAMDRLRELDRLKSDFLARMSHELRTPLNAVIGFAQLLAMDEQVEDRAGAVQQILKAARHLLDLINEVLDIAQIEAGELNLSIEPVAVDDVISAAAKLIEPIAEHERIVVTLPDRDPDRFVLVDRQRVVQILLNLLSNAVKYNRPGGQINVSVHVAEPRVRIAVRDTGPGIPDGDQARLFAPFDRLGREQTDIEGSGIGLMLARGLAARMNCHLELAESSASGSTFVLDLPRVDPVVPDRGHQQQAATGQTALADADGPGPVKVLYIEDNLSNLRLVEAILEHVPNVELLTAMQGRLGFELAVEHRPDLVLLDVHLPDIDGDEVLAQIRAHGAVAATRVVFLSADATPKHVERLLEAGSDGYLTKPFDLVQLIDEVETARAAASA
jgi:signal transduction histidine kinase